jgi:hypothetical protein
LGPRQQLGLIVDQPKPGFGISNDGNTARSFFEDDSVSTLILLQVISSGYAICF